MRLIYLILCIIVFTSSWKTAPSDKTSEPGLNFQATLKGRYNTFILLETKLINNTNKEYEFFAYSCTTVGNIVTDSKEMTICINDCAGNHTSLIKLKPKEEFIMPVILQYNRFNYNKTKIGIILISPKDIVDLSDFRDLIMKCRANNEKVLWSNPIDINIAGGQPYEIRVMPENKVTNE